MHLPHSTTTELNCGDFLPPAKTFDQETPPAESWEVLENAKYCSQAGWWAPFWLFQLLMTYLAFSQRSQDLCSNSNRAVALFSDLGSHPVTRKDWYMCTHTHQLWQFVEGAGVCIKHLSYLTEKNKKIHSNFDRHRSYTSALQLCPHWHQWQGCHEPERDLTLGHG